MITSPYNFVPLSDKVVSPYWAKQVSHDIPFEDAQSGVLDLIIRAESPIYVRNGTPSDASEDQKNACNNINGQYFIPGSSIKGMLRSVMEIMSFGRMANKVNDHKYSVRDFQNNDIYPKSELAREVNCGWLYKEGEEYFLIDCEKPGRISHRALDTKFETSMSAFYKTAIALAGPISKSAKAKYDQFDLKNKDHMFTIHADNVGRSLCSFDPERGTLGTIVFSGQASVRKEPDGERPSGKHLEFVFFNRKKNPEKLTPEVIKNFFFAYYDQDRPQQKEDWKWRKPQLDKGEKIPVFFRRNSGGKGILDMGLTLLYKITYKNSIVDAIKLQQKNANNYDLAETIFGYAEGNDALKSRVHIGHAFTKEKPLQMAIVAEVLAEPKASYYPTYIEQNSKTGIVGGVYKTLMNDDAKLKGWKRYPVRNNNIPVSNPGTQNISTKFSPLPAGTEFSLQVHYHNLRKEELGALLSAITFHNTPGLYHSIGTGKPLGYGKISLQVSNLPEEVILACLKPYEIFMEWSLGGTNSSWIKSSQLSELFSMAKPGTNDESLKYMALTDFVNAKGRRRNDQKFTLQRYSEILNNKVEIKPLSLLSEIEEADRKYVTEKVLFENQQDINKLKLSIKVTQEKEFKNNFESKKLELLEKLSNKKLELEDKGKQEKVAATEKARIEKAINSIPEAWHNVKIVDFKNLKNRVPSWTKHFNSITIPDQFVNEFTGILKKIIQLERSDRKKSKDWAGKFEEINNYKTIISWIGEAKAQALFDELNNS